MCVSVGCLRICAYLVGIWCVCLCVSGVCLCISGVCLCVSDVCLCVPGGCLRVCAYLVPICVSVRIWWVSVYLCISGGCLRLSVRVCVYVWVSAYLCVCVSVDVSVRVYVISVLSKSGPEANCLDCGGEYLGTGSRRFSNLFYRIS